MDAVSKFNAAFDYGIVDPAPVVVRAMIDLARLRGRADIATALQLESGWREHLANGSTGLQLADKAVRTPMGGGGE